MSKKSEGSVGDTGGTQYERFKWLAPGKLAGGPHPDLYDGLVNVAPFFRSQGIGAILSVYDKPLTPDPGEFGFRYLFAETPNFRPPQDLPPLLQFIHEEVEQGRGVLVHCFAGIGRTGTVLAAWLLQQDVTLSAAEAISRVREEYVPEYARLRFPEDPSQAEAIERYARAR